MTLLTALLILIPTNVATFALGSLWGLSKGRSIRVGDVMTERTAPSTRAPRWMYVIAAMTAFVGVAVIALGVMVINAQSQQDRLVGCVEGYSNAAAAAQRARSAATSDVFNQIDAVFSKVLVVLDDAATDGRQQIFDAIKAYDDARTAAKQAQKDNPLPEAPENACADLLK